jgi:hypothetical protein
MERREKKKIRNPLREFFVFLTADAVSAGIFGFVEEGVSFGDEI